MSARARMTSRWGAVAAAIALVIGAGAVAVTVVGTQAAWTDRVVVGAGVTSGEWAAPVTNTCNAWDQNGNVVKCAVKGITFSTWQESPTRRARNYSIQFDAPNAKKIVFSVDLTTATTTSPAESPAWSWSNVGISSDAQFKPVDGWTCAGLPKINGQANDWSTNVYFHAYENRAISSGMCP